MRSTVPPGDLSQSAVLALLGKSGPLGRAELARRLGVSAATVTKATRELIARGLVREMQSVPSEGGRPARLLGLASDGGQALGIKVTADRVTGVLVGLDGEIADSFAFPYEGREPDAVQRLVEGLAPHAQGARRRLLGIGVGLPGGVDLADGGAVDSPMLGWFGVRLGTALERAFGLPALVDNDVNTVAVAERLYGRGQEFSTFLVVTIGRGIGLAMLLDGRLYRGARGGAGEFGHWPVPNGDRLCECGNTGCLETLIGEAGLVATARARKVLSRNAGYDELAAQADQGGTGAREIFAEAGELLGRNVAGLVNVLNPGVLLITGEGVACWRHWQAEFQRAMRAHLFGMMRRTHIIAESLDDFGWARGAAALVLAVPLAAVHDYGRASAHIRARLAGAVNADD
ncbi:ROK family transcriptional regulator [Actinomadura logoneensis]|uniref:ROK family transcriptional regulator n=1 Tax=Actinomadura logoneensis TaxID=2293572 RepID=A0A372JJD3_9ACTN|nr:ROK family transcriptional regulator [Actinomadura logoneensis]RFU39926.1 ROK family transcriptional regulator [Actinomadura logoneensis]